MKRSGFGWFGLPALLWFTLFLLGPLLQTLVLSFQRRGPYGEIENVWQLENYHRTLQPVYSSILFRSLGLACLTALLCAVIALPLVWGLTSLSPRWKKRVLLLLAVPFFVSLIARIYALKSALNIEGPMARVFSAMGLTEVAMHLSQNFPLVLYGLVVTYLPFLLLPLWVQLEKIDPLQMEAAVDLGATPWQGFRRVILPQLRPAMASGLMLVLVPVLGEYLIPDLLGGAKVMLAGNLIAEQFLKARDWPFGAALAIELVLLLGLCGLLCVRWGARGAKR